MYKDEPPDQDQEQQNFNFRFSGQTYSKKHDQKRLTGQILRIYDLMQDGRWRTLAEIERVTRDPQASISARLRDFRKERFGGHELNKQPRGDRDNGLWDYQLIVNKTGRIE